MLLLDLKIIPKKEEDKILPQKKNLSQHKIPKKKSNLLFSPFFKKNEIEKTLKKINFK